MKRPDAFGLKSTMQPSGRIGHVNYADHPRHENAKGIGTVIPTPLQLNDGAEFDQRDAKTAPRIIPN